MSSPLKTFIIYARDDKSHKDLLLRHLKPLIASSVINVWHDGDILPGDDWQEAINRNIKSSDLILVLVSVNSLNSDFIQKKELSEALNRLKDGNAKIVPIIVDPCMWSLHPVFKGLQGLPDNMRPISSWLNMHEAWTNVVTRLYEMSLEILEEPIKPPIERTRILIIKTYGADNVEAPLDQSMLTIDKNQERIYDGEIESGGYELSGLVLRDKVQIQVSKQGYITKLVKIDLADLFKDKSIRTRILTIILNVNKSIGGNDDLFKPQGGGGRINIEAITGKELGKQPETKVEPVREPILENQSVKLVEKEPIISTSPSKPRQDVSAREPATKKESFVQQLRKQLISHSTVVIGIGGIILFFLIILAVVLPLTQRDKPKTFNYTDLNTKIDDFKKEINYKSQRLWDATKYEETIRFLQNSQNEIDSLSRIPSIIPDSLKYSREQLDEIRDLYKVRVVSDRDTLLKGVDFDSVKTDLLIKAFLALKLDSKSDTMFLMDFARVCYWVNRSNDIINGLNPSITVRNETIKRLLYIETDARYYFLTNDQKAVLRSYRKVLNIMGSKVYANAEEIVTKMYPNYPSGERIDVSDFLKKRKNK